MIILGFQNKDKLLMNMFLHILVIIVCCGALWLGAVWLVDSAARIAKRLGISELVIGLTVVAFGTSAPEFAATIGAAVQNIEGIPVGNVVGSNIFNIGFILGGCALVSTIPIKPALVWRDGLVLLVITVALFFMLLGGRLERWEGLLLVLGLVGYLWYLIIKREAVIEEEVPGGKASWRDGVFLVLGLGLIIAGGTFLVRSAEYLALQFGMSNWVVGMTVVAAGTSLPEFVISLVAVLRKHHGISAGNLIGSNLFNTLGVLGVAGLLRPLAVERSSLVSILMLIGLTGLVVLFMRTKWRLARWEGAVLILISLAMWGYNLCFN